jgi:hypothetical protein
MKNNEELPREEAMPQGTFDIELETLEGPTSDMAMVAFVSSNYFTAIGHTSDTCCTCENQ